MIKITRLNGKEFYVNPDMVVFAEETPDTVLTLTDGRKIVISESADDFVGLVVEYRVKVAKNVPRIIARMEE